MSDFGKDINVPINDCISRQAATEAITNYAKFLWDNFHETCNLAGMIDAIDALPTIDPVKHGRWVPWDLSWGRSVWSCSKCRDAMEVPTEMGNPIYKFCPNCGARMDEVTE